MASMPKESKSEATSAVLLEPLLEYGHAMRAWVGRDQLVRRIAPDEIGLAQLVKLLLIDHSHQWHYQLGVSGGGSKQLRVCASAVAAAHENITKASSLNGPLVNGSNA